MVEDLRIYWISLLFNFVLIFSVFYWGSDKTLDDALLWAFIAAPILSLMSYLQTQFDPESHPVTEPESNEQHKASIAGLVIFPVFFAVIFWCFA